MNKKLGPEYVQQSHRLSPVSPESLTIHTLSPATESSVERVNTVTCFQVHIYVLSDGSILETSTKPSSSTTCLSSENVSKTWTIGKHRAAIL